MPTVELASEHQSDIFLHLPGHNQITAAPPSPHECFYAGAEIENINGRLRAASDMHMNGYLSAEEKYVMKKLVLANDTELSERIDIARNTGDWNSVKGYLSNKQNTYEDAHVIVNEMIDMSIGVSQVEDEEFDPEFDANLLFDSGPLDTTYNPEAHHRIPVHIPHGELLEQDRYMKTQSQSIINDGKLISESNKRSVFSIPEPGLQILPLSEAKTEQEFMPHIIVGRRANKRRDIATGKNQNGKSKCARLPRRSKSDFGSIQGKKRSSSASSFSKARKVKASSNDDMEGDSSDVANDEKGVLSKSKKNERERKRRLAVSQGFDELSQLLLPKDSEEEGKGATKVDKATILRKTIDTIKSFERRLEILTRENEKLRLGFSA